MCEIIKFTETMAYLEESGLGKDATVCVKNKYINESN